MNRKVFKRVLSLLIVAAMLAGIMPSDMKADVAVAADVAVEEDSLVSAELGDRVLFGQYYQESEEYKSPIEWSVVETSEVYTSSDGEKVQDLTLFSVNALDYDWDNSAVSYYQLRDNEFYAPYDATVVKCIRSASFYELVNWKEYVKTGRVTIYAYENAIDWEGYDYIEKPFYYIEEYWTGKGYGFAHSYVGGMCQHEWSDTEGTLIYGDTYSIDDDDFENKDSDPWDDNNYGEIGWGSAYLRPVIEITMPVDEIEYAYDTIYYNAKGGKIDPAYDTYRKGEGKELRTPTKTGYDFCGWYYDEKLTNPVVDNKIPLDMSGDITVYAKWRVKAADLVVTDIGYTKLAPSEDDEVIFVAMVDNIGTHYAPGGSFRVVFYVDGADAYVTWSEIISYDLNPGSSTTIMARYGGDGNDGKWICGPNEEYTITAWVDDQNKIFEYDEINNKYSEVLTTSPFRIDYEPNGGTVEGDAFELYRSGTERDLKVPVKEGYEFDGWYFNSELTEPVADNKITADMKGDFTVYAKWTEEKYKVVEYGQFPKSEVAETEELLNAEWISKYCGSDYCKNTVDVHYATLADGTRYARIVNDEGNYQYFKFEPIKWIVTDEDEEGNYTLLSKDVIDATYYYYDAYNGYNSAEQSAILSRLNPTASMTQYGKYCADGIDFQEIAFSTEELDKINRVEYICKTLGAYWLEEDAGVLRGYTIETPEESAIIMNRWDIHSAFGCATYSFDFKFGLLSEEATKKLDKDALMADYTDFADSRFYNAHSNTGNKTYWLQDMTRYTFDSDAHIEYSNTMVVNSDTGIINTYGIANEYYPDGTGNKSGVRPVINVNKSVFEEEDSTEEPTTETPTEEPTTEAPTEEPTTEAPQKDKCPTVHIEAEEFVEQSGIEIAEKIYEGSQFINSIGNKDTATYDVELLGTGNYTIAVRASTQYTGDRSVKVYVDGTYVTTVDITNTGAWSTFNTFLSEEVFLEKGRHTVTLEAVGGGYNINWIEFIGDETEEESEPVEDRDVTLHIEAEDYSDMKGVELRGTFDQGTDVLKSVDAGDWMTYTVDVEVPGKYTFFARAARPDAAPSTLSLIENGKIISTIDITGTGGWSNFAEFTGTEAVLTAGTHTFKVYADGGRYNLNWFELVHKAEGGEGTTEAPGETETEGTTEAPEAGNCPTVHIEAEDFASQSGIEIASKIYEDSQFINSIGHGDSATYNVELLGTGNYKIGVRASTKYDGNRTVEVYVDGTYVTTIAISSTGAWENFNTFESKEFYFEKGSHEVTLKAVGGGYNINWFEFIGNETGEEAETQPETETGTETEPGAAEDEQVVITIEAEEYDSMSGVELRGTYDQGTDVLKSVDAGDYMIYTVEVPTTGTYRFDVRGARSDGGTSLLSLMENDEVIASVKVASTGSWNTFAEFEGTEVELTAGTHTFKVYADGGRYNLNWYKLMKVS